MNNLLLFLVIICDLVDNVNIDYVEDTIDCLVSFAWDHYTSLHVCFNVDTNLIVRRNE